MLGLDEELVFDVGLHEVFVDVLQLTNRHEFWNGASAHVVHSAALPLSLRQLRLLKQSFAAPFNRYID